MKIATSLSSIVKYIQKVQISIEKWRKLQWRNVIVSKTLFWLKNAKYYGQLLLPLNAKCRSFKHIIQ